MTEWTKEWPAEPGRYWFWGQMYPTLWISYPPAIHLVTAYRAENDVLVYSVGGRLITPTREGKGVWCPAVVPEPPRHEGDEQ